MGQALKFYTDEHVAKAVVSGLRQRGVDVVTLIDRGLLGADDERHLELAVAEKRVVFTQDADFLRLHASGNEHCGIVYAPQGTPIGDIIRGLMLIYQVLNSGDMMNHVEFLKLKLLASKSTVSLNSRYDSESFRSVCSRVFPVPGRCRMVTGTRPMDRPVDSQRRLWRNYILSRRLLAASIVLAVVVFVIAATLSPYQAQQPMPIAG